MGSDGEERGRSETPTPDQVRGGETEINNCYGIREKVGRERWNKD
jgi:hypothetical protein